jgi:hypothetical protein
VNVNSYLMSVLRVKIFLSFKISVNFKILKILCNQPSPMKFVCDSISYCKKHFCCEKYVAFLILAVKLLLIIK